MQKEKKYEFWTDSIAKEVVCRKKFHFTDDAVPKLKKFVVKSAASVSGVLHIGRLSDTIRCEAVYRSLIDAGHKAEFIWTADNVDPLRKIPQGVPESYKQYIGVPVTEIPDPDGCHKSYEEHHKSAYISVVNQFIQSKMKMFSMREEYLKGTFKKEIKIILDNYEKIVEIQNKNRLKDRSLPEGWSPWQPICKNCGKIITPRVTKVENDLVYYVCKDYDFKTQKAVGCNYEGIDDPSKGNGKLLYKSELAAQWYHWKVCSEGFGKEYIVPGSAFWINAEIIEKVFKFPMAVPIFYEYLIINGEKMSASVGNVVYPKDWLQVATPELLRLLFLKDPMRERNFRWADIPNMMDENDNLEKIYYGKKKIESERDKVTYTRLFELMQLKSLPKKCMHIAPFSVFVEIAKILPDKDQVDFAVEKLKQFGHVRTLTPSLKKKISERLELAKSWYEKYGRSQAAAYQISNNIKPAIYDLIECIKNEKDGEKIQKALFEIAKKHGITIQEFFKTIYQILFQSNQGPKLGPYIIDRGKNEIIEKLRDAL